MSLMRHQGGPPETPGTPGGHEVEGSHEWEDPMAAPEEATDTEYDPLGLGCDLG